MPTLKTILGLKNNMYHFSNIDSAFRWANNSEKSHMVFLGYDNQYWVVCFSDAQKLFKLGFEIAEN